MLAELLLTLTAGAGVAALIFVLCFNTTTTTKVAAARKQNKKKQKTKRSPQKKRPGKPKPKKAQKTSISELYKQLGQYAHELAEAAKKPEITLADHADQHLISVFRAPKDHITGLAWHCSGQFLFCGSRDGTLYVYDRPTQPRIEIRAAALVKSRDDGHFTAVHALSTAPNA